MKEVLATSWRWWTDELKTFIPFARGRTLSRFGDLAFLWNVSDQSLQAIKSDTVDPVTLSLKEWASAFQGQNCAIFLRAEDTLMQAGQLPAAAASTLFDVVGFELDRLTPFSAQDVYYDCRALRNTQESGQIQVEIALIPRDALTPIFDTANTANITLVSVNTFPNGQYNLLRSAPNFKAARRWGKMPAIACAIFVIAGLAAIWANAHAQHRELAGLDKELARLRTSVAGLDGQRGGLKSMSAARFVDERRAKELSVVEVLDAVTQSLDGDSWIVDFRFRNEELELRGYSADAARLITVFDALPTFYDVRFTQPIMQEERSQLQQFHLAIRISARKNDQS